MAIQVRKNGSVVVSVRITLKPGRDDDLIALVYAAEKLAPAIREAMRNGIQAEYITTQDDDDDDDFALLGVSV